MSEVPPDDSTQAPPTLPAFVLPPGTMERMHQTAVAILGRTGMRVEHPEIREAIARRKGFSLVDGRLLIDAEKVEAWRSSIRPAAPMHLPSPEAAPLGFSCSSGDRASYVVADDCRTLRPMTRDDVVEGAKLINVLHDKGVRGTTPGVPMDAPPALQPIEQFMIGAEYSRSGGATPWVCDIRTAEIIRDMERVYGRPCKLTVHSPSGLVLGGAELDILWRFRSEVKRVTLGTMPMMGITGPCDPIGVFTLAIAECLGGAAILHELLPDVAVAIGPHPQPANMSTGAMVFGSPEWETLDLMHFDVLAWYGQGRGKPLLTSATVPDAQAMIEHTTSAASGMLRGYRRFHPVGQLALDEVYSPAMLILDVDILAHVYRAMCHPIGGQAELAGLGDLVDETVRQGMLFAEQPSTVAAMRQQYYQPMVLRRMNRSQWTAAGRPDIVRDAQALAHRLAGQYRYEAPADILRDLRRIYEKAKITLSRQP